MPTPPSEFPAGLRDADEPAWSDRAAHREWVRGRREDRLRRGWTPSEAWAATVLTDAGGLRRWQEEER